MTRESSVTNDNRAKQEKIKSQSAILEMWRDRVRNEILPNILQHDIPLFSADIIAGQVLIAHIPIAKYLNAGSWKDKLADIKVSLVYIEETLAKTGLTEKNVLKELTSHNCPVIEIRKYPSAGGFMEIKYGDALLSVSFCPEGTPSTYNGIPFREVYHCF